MTKQALQDRVLSSASSVTSNQKDQDADKDNSASIKSGVMDGIVGGNAATRQNQSTQVMFGYPPRSAQSDRAARILENVIAAEGKKQTSALGAQIREDGTIVLAVSGGDVSKVQSIYNRYNTNLQQELSQVFGNDPLIAKDSNGNVRFELGPADAITDHLKKSISFVNNNYNLDTYTKEDRICVEDRLFQASNTTKAQSMTVIWRTEYNTGAKPSTNEYIERLDNPDSKVMVPCVSCKENAESIMSANMASKERTNLMFQKGGRLITNAGIGVTISAGFYTLNQLMEGKPIEGSALAKESAVGAGTGIVSNYVEQQVSSKLLLATKATLSSSQLISRQMIGSSAAGVVVGSGMAAYQNYDTYKNGKISGEEYAANIGKEAAISGLSAAAGTAVGATIGGTIGSTVPVAGTVVGIAVGAAIGYAVDGTLRIMIDGKPTEKLILPISAYNQGVQFQVPVYPSDRQFDVVTRTFEMMAKSAGLPQNEVGKFVNDWQARYQLGGSDKIVYYSQDNAREITDSEFEQIKTQGFMMSLVKGDTHAELINDLKNRLGKVVNSPQ
ncbi:MAG: hypothetical protein AB1489_30800 [Acidobacteriota bacterium]